MASKIDPLGFRSIPMCQRWVYRHSMECWEDFWGCDPLVWFRPPKYESQIYGQTPLRIYQLRDSRSRICCNITLVYLCAINWGLIIDIDTRFSCLQAKSENYLRLSRTYKAQTIPRWHRHGPSIRNLPERVFWLVLKFTWWNTHQHGLTTCNHSEFGVPCKQYTV